MPVAILLVTGARLRPSNLAGMVMAQVAWNLLAAVLMVREQGVVLGVDPK